MRQTFFVTLEGPANAVTTNRDAKRVAVAGRNGECLGDCARVRLTLTVATVPLSRLLQHPLHLYP